MSIKVFMVIPENAETPILRERWIKAEEALSNAGAGFVIERISHGDILAFGKTTSFTRESIFVLSKFEGKAFEHLLALNCRIYGTPCILQCISRRTPLPTRSQAIYSQVLPNALVCCSGLERELKCRMFKLVRWLAGDYQLDLTFEVTHLIANKVGSAKYTAFLRFNKPILTTAWLEELWDTAETTYPFPFELLDDTARFALPSFAGLVICTSGFRDDERRFFKQSIEKHGGKFSGQLRHDESTHLVVKELSGEKYEAAQQWGTVKIVAPSWLLDSMHANCCLPEDNYTLYGPRAPKASEIVPPPESVHCKKIAQTAMSEVTSFMSNCSIYLYNLPSTVAENLRKCIITAGAMCVDEPLELVTHVVALEQSLTEAEVIVTSHCSLAHIVSPDWIRESFNARKVLDESLFDYRVKTTAANTTNDEAQSSCKVSIQSEQSHQSKGSTSMDITDGVVGDKSYQWKSDVSCFDHIPFHRIVIDWPKPKIERFNEAVAVLKKIDCEIVPLSLVNNSTESIDMLIVPFGQAPSTAAERIINSGGVTYVNSLFLDVVKNAWERYAKSYRFNTAALKPQLLGKLIPDLEEQLKNPIVTTVAPTFSCLENCCITLTGFDCPERSLLTRLVISLGAAYQEMFARTTTATVGSNSMSVQLQRSTHLIAAKAAGEKFEKARRWNVPVVKRDWLLDCWRSGCRIPEDNYILRNLTPAVVNTTINETVVLGDKSIMNNTRQEDVSVADVDIPTERLLNDTKEITEQATPSTDEKLSISRRLDAILAASKPTSAEISSRRTRPSPVKTPSFVAPRRPTVPTSYGIESSQSLQVMWGDDTASNRFSLGVDRIEEENVTEYQQPTSARLRSLTLVEDALSSPNGSLFSDNAGHPKSSPLLNCNSNSEPAAVRAPDAVVIGPSVLHNAASVFPADNKSVNGSLGRENITRTSLTPPVFQFSGLTASERDDAAALLERLGARVVAVPTSTMADGVPGSYGDSPLETSCTHLIVAEPSRTQKFLSGIAGGKWILHRSYIDACRVENRLVDESPFEWGSGGCAEPPPSACRGDKNLAKRLASAAHRWRLKLAGNTKKAFANWKVILLIPNQQIEHSCRQILIAGGATIVSLPVDYSPPAASTFTHWLVDPSLPHFLASNAQLSSSSILSPAKQARYQLLRRCYDCLMRFIASCGGPEAPNSGGCVLRHEYLQNYLLDDPIPGVRHHLVNTASLALPASLSSSSSMSSPARKIPGTALQRDSDFAHVDKRLKTVYNNHPNR